MFVVGVLDDRIQLSPLAKLVSSLIIGAFLVFFLTRDDVALPWTHTLIATVWFAGVCHAFNLLDNMDGLATGVALIAAAFMAWLLAPALGPPLALLLVALCGSLLGFLYWNRPPARIFMGDCGSLFIGATIAGASLMPVLQERTAFPWTSVLVVLILVVPLFDTGFVAGPSSVRGTKRDARRHRSRVASAGVARVLGTERRPHPLPAGALSAAAPRGCWSASGSSRWRRSPRCSAWS